MNVLVTGVTGFIGYSLAQALVGEGYNVYGLVRFTSTDRKAPEGVNKVVGDLTDYHYLAGLIETIRPEVVFHLGALTPVSLSYNQPRAFAEANYIGTVNLLEAIRMRGCETIRLVAIAGTTEMYDTDGVINDSASFKPESPYAVSKIASMLYAEYMYRAYKLPIVIVVPTNTYGRALVNQRHFFIEKLITGMLEGKKVIELGSPDAMRDWMFREDHVEAYMLVMRATLNGKDDVIGQRFYFGTGRSYTTKETAEIVRKIVGWDGAFKWGVYNRPVESKKITVDYGKSWEVLKWKPKYDLESGIKRAVKEWREILEV